MLFEWDENKNRANRAKHGIDFNQRYQLIGSVFARIILVAHSANVKSLTDVAEEEVIRSISARKATPGKGNSMKKTQPTEAQKKQLKALDAIRDADIDLSDIPDQTNQRDWVRGAMYRPLMRAISIRLPAPDIALAQDLAGKKGLPYQTYIKQLLHDALIREQAGI